MTRRIRFWLADRLEGLAIRLGNGEHGRGCKGICRCWQAGRDRDFRPL